MKRKNILIILGVVLIVLSLVLIGGIGTLLQISGRVNFLTIVPGYESVYKAFYGHICCEEGAYEPPYVRYLDDRPLYICDSYTDECRVKIHPAEDLGLANRVYYYEICDINGINCGSKIREGFSSYSKKEEEILHYLNYGKSIKFSPYPLNPNDLGYLQYEADHKKFYIQGVENGKVFVASSCILNSDLRKRVLTGGLNELAKIGANRCQNYITDYILVETKTYPYGLGRDVICQARQIYDIDVLNLLDDSTRYIQGNRIKDVECCPTEANCDVDFKWKEVVEKECNYGYECPNAGNPIALTGTSYIEYNCLNGMCKQSDPINVQCTNNAVCVALYNKPNMACKNWRCVEDEVWIGHCGDDKCESVIGETSASCPDDCAEGKLCPFGQEYREEVDYPWYKFWRSDKPAGCYTATWVIVLIVLFVIILLIGGIIGIFILYGKLKNLRK